METLNPYLSSLGPYPFQRLNDLIAGVQPPADRSPIRFSVGEPRHPLPRLISEAFERASGGISTYPLMWGGMELRSAIADWVARRFAPAVLDPATQVIPVNGVREGLFSFGQTVLNAQRKDSFVICPNPGYAVYDGVTYLTGLQPYYVDNDPADTAGNYYRRIPAEVWERTQVVFVGTPDNPRGGTMSLEAWQTLFALADRYGALIASDEVYCEIYPDESQRPIGSLQAAATLGRSFERLAAFHSLSKRSNAPGLRSGFIAGDPALMYRIEQFRSYNGGGMSPAVQAASLAAWRDEAHVVANRALYREKYDTAIPILQEVMPVGRPKAGFFLWADVRGSGMTDEAFALELFAEEHVLVLPGTYLTQRVDGRDPGEGFVRIALVAEVGECVEGARRIAAFHRRRAAA